MIIKYFGELADLTGKELEIRSAGLTAKQLLAELVKSYGPEFGMKIFTPDKQLQGIFLLLNGRHIRYYQGLDTILREEDELCFMPFIDGG